MSSGPPDRERVPPAAPGDRIHRYEIIELLGSGGMGVVYRARDLELGRDVALKCPWRDISSDQHFRARFLRESRASARLSHPNIVQILDAFEEGDVPWIAMQLVEGETLDSYIAWKGKLAPRQVVRFAEQLALALEEAHKHRVLHRDVKPRNIMIEKEKRALLMDFGLARIMRDTDAGSQASTEETTLTGDGAIVGTPRYLSPEQARGEDIDGRSDIFSLGVVLYEMCTGVAAFGESQMANLIEAIMHREPAPISQFTYEVPVELERIIRKCLAKRPDQRYQDTRDLLVDLRNLRKELDFDEASSSHGYELHKPRSKRRTILWVLAYATFAACAIVLWSKFFRGDPPIPQAVTIEVTSGESWNGEPAISPEGTRIAFTSDRSGNRDIYVTDVRGGNPIPVTRHPEDDYDPAWLEDGSAILFTSYRSGEPAIWKTGQMGGGATMIVSNASDPAVAPNGVDLAFSRADSNGTDRLFRMTIGDPASVRRITSDDDGPWNHRNAAWSRDGNTICYQTSHNLWTVPADGGGASPLTESDRRDSDPAYAFSGEHIYFASFVAGTSSIWRTTPDGGTSKRVTIGSAGESSPSLSSDGRFLTFARTRTENTLVIANRTLGTEHHIEGFEGETRPAISPDGSVVYFATNRWGKNSDLCRVSIRNGEAVGDPVRLTDGPGNASHPVISPDGRWLAYYLIEDGKRDVWCLSSEGGTPTRVTTDPTDDFHPAWSPEGGSLAFVSEREGGAQVWIVPVVDGSAAGDPRRITSGTQTCLSPSFSFDGRRIAFIAATQESRDAWVVAIDDPASARRVPNTDGVEYLRWDGASEDLLVAAQWAGNERSLRRVSIADGEVRSVRASATFGGPLSVPLFDVTADGSLLIHFQTAERSGVWVLEAESGSF